MEGERDRDALTRQFIAQHGRANLRTLLSMLVAGESNDKIAFVFRADLATAKRWRRAFGQTETVYVVAPDVEIASHGGAPVREEEIAPC